MKKCPYCAEEIQDEAIKCKHCGSWLDGREEPTSPSESQVEFQQPWVIRTWGTRLRLLGILICFFGAMMLLQAIWLRRMAVPPPDVEWDVGSIVAGGLLVLIGFVVFIVGRSKDQSLSK